MCFTPVIRGWAGNKTKNLSLKMLEFDLKHVYEPCV